MTIEELQQLVLADHELMTILSIIETLPLKDCWLAAGAIRNAIWNHLAYGIGFDPLTDVDVIFFDPEISYEAGRLLEEQLKGAYPLYQWELRNQAYMAAHNPKTPPYRSSQDTIARYPERCTAIAVRLVGGQLEVFAPYGLADISHFVCRPTPHFLEDSERMDCYRQRLAKKDWHKKWPQLTCHDC